MKNKASEVESDPQEDKNHSNKRQRIWFVKAHVYD
jgi:hypothetical protein